MPISRTVIPGRCEASNPESRDSGFALRAPRNDWDIHPHSRGTTRPSFSSELHRPAIKRAQGRPGAHRTHGPRAAKKHAAEPQVQADHPAFPAQWFYGLYVTSPVTMLGCHRRLRVVSRKLNASIGAPGPHDFAVRSNVVRLVDTAASIASRPAFVTTRPPLLGTPSKPNHSNTSFADLTGSDPSS